MKFNINITYLKKYHFCSVSFLTVLSQITDHSFFTTEHPMNTGEVAYNCLNLNSTLLQI